MSVIRRSALALTLLSLTAACGYVRRAQDRRLTEWQEAAITVAEAREILGTAPYAVPGLEIVAIHVDRPSRVVMVTQRLEPGRFIGLSQHRGHYLPPTTRPFWVIERYNLERVPYTAEPRADGNYVQVENGATASMEQQVRTRRFTRWTEDLTIRIWGGRLGDEQQVKLLNEAQPIET